MSEVAAVTVACGLHGEVDLPADAVYLRHLPVGPAVDGVRLHAWHVLILCDGHVICRPISSSIRVALVGAGAKVADEATAVLLVRLISPHDAAMASQALTEVENLQQLRSRAAVQAGRHLYVATTDAAQQHVAGVATALATRIAKLRSERGEQ